MNYGTLRLLVCLARRAPALWQSGRSCAFCASPGRRPPTCCAVQNRRSRPWNTACHAARRRDETKPGPRAVLHSARLPGGEHVGPSRPAPLRNEARPARGLAQCKTPGGGTRRAKPPGAITKRTQREPVPCCAAQHCVPRTAGQRARSEDSQEPGIPAGHVGRTGIRAVLTWPAGSQDSCPWLLDSRSNTWTDRVTLACGVSPRRVGRCRAST